MCSRSGRSIDRQRWDVDDVDVVNTPKRQVELLLGCRKVERGCSRSGDVSLRSSRCDEGGRRVGDDYGRYEGE